MKVSLDLAGELEGELAPELVRRYQVPDGASVQDLLDSLPFAGRIALTSVNGEMVPPASRAGRILEDGDEVMMLPAIKGG